MSTEQRQNETNTLPSHLRGNNRVRRRLRAGLHPSSMVAKAGWFAWFWGKRLFGRVRFSHRSIDAVRDAATHSTVVYVVHTRSWLDYLYFNFAFILHDLPLARFANNVRTVMVRPVFGIIRSIFRRRFPAKEVVFDEALESSQSSLIFLNKPHSDDVTNRLFSDAYLHGLITYAAREHSKPVSVIPLLLMWEKRSESYHKTVFDDVFGTRQSPGAIRKFYHLVQNVWQSLLRAGSPTMRAGAAIDLQEFSAERDKLSIAERTDALRSELIDIFGRERRVIVGPPLKPAHVIRAEILDSRPVQEAIQQVVRDKHIFNPRKIKRRAKKIVKEIAADFSLVAIKVLSAFVNPVFDAIFKGFDIDADGLERIRETAKEKRLVIVPSHKSHLDYLIISNIFYQHGLTPPHIAAGVNLSFWPLGTIFRRSGAFFLRRSFKGDPLYSAIFTQYLTKVMHEGFPVEFFIEGTRSRTGKLSRPRYGMISMILSAAVDKRVDNIAILPVSVGYERIVESYSKEMLGAEKKGENLSGVLKATKLLRSKYGRVYIEFDDPIDLDLWVAEAGLVQGGDKGEFQRAARSLAYQIIAQIDSCTTVTPSAVAAMVLLNNPDPRVPHELLVEQAGFVLRYISEKDARLSNSITHAFEARRMIVGTASERTDDRSTNPSELLPSTDEVDPLETIASMTDSEAGMAMRRLIQEAMELFRTKDLIKIEGPADERVYAVDDKHRPELSFYRNNIVHFFVPEAIFATALLAQDGGAVELEFLREQCRFLSRVFKNEFCFGPRDSFSQAFDASLQIFLKNGWVTEAEPGVSIVAPDEPAAGTEFLRGMLTNWLEGYWLVAQALEDLVKEPMDKKDFFKRCFKRGRRLYLQDELLHYESMSQPAFQNALDLFKERGLVEGESKTKLTVNTEHPDLTWQGVVNQLGSYRRKQRRSPTSPLRAVEVPTDALSTDAG